MYAVDNPNPDALDLTIDELTGIIEGGGGVDAMHSWQREHMEKQWNKKRQTAETPRDGRNRQSRVGVGHKKRPPTQRCGARWKRTWSAWAKTASSCKTGHAKGS